MFFIIAHGLALIRDMNQLIHCRSWPKATISVDNFVKKSRDKCRKAWQDAVCDTLMILLAIKTPIKSMTCMDESAFAAGFSLFHSYGAVLWSIQAALQPEMNR